MYAVTSECRQVNRYSGHVGTSAPGMPLSTAALHWKIRLPRNPTCQQTGIRHEGTWLESCRHHSGSMLAATSRQSRIFDFAGQADFSWDKIKVLTTTLADMSLVVDCLMALLRFPSFYVELISHLVLRKIGILLAIKGPSKERKYRTIRLASVNIGTLTGRSRELAATLKKRKVYIACVQETRWKRAKSRGIGDGYKLIYHGTTSGHNGVGIIVNNDYRDFVTSVQLVSDRLMSIKITEGSNVLRIASAYAPQCGCTEDTNEQFYRGFEELLQGFDEGENVIIGGDFSGHVGSARDGYERWHGGQGYGARNEMGTMLLDHAEAADLAVVNTFFKKKNEHLITYCSGGRATQIDYILVRRKELKN
ncbi:hypothetical protein Y032_0636g936 [Ancylostoma ceylanicum]|nr:hypothetical protein Y032_0636g936 [Ancylostoma ceylanicum]